MLFDCMYICSTDTLTSWSNEGISTEILVNSTRVKCLSNHLSSFAVIAEDTTIEIPTVITNSSNVSTTTTAATTTVNFATDTTPTTATMFITESSVTTDVTTSMKDTSMQY